MTNFPFWRLVGALGTVAVAAFTYQLWRVNKKLANLTEREQRKREAEIAIKRLRISHEEDGPIEFDLWVVNRGWQPTGLEEVWLKTEGGNEEVTDLIFSRIDGTGQDRMVDVGEWVKFRGEIAPFSKDQTLQKVRFDLVPVLGPAPEPITFQFPESGEAINLRVRDGSTFGTYLA